MSLQEESLRQEQQNGASQPPSLGMQHILEESLRISHMTTVYGPRVSRKMHGGQLIIITPDNSCMTVKIRGNEDTCDTCDSLFQNASICCGYCVNVVPGRFIECSGARGNDIWSIRLTSDGEIQNNIPRDLGYITRSFERLSKFRVNHVTVARDCLFFSTTEGDIYGYSLEATPLLQKGREEIKKLNDTPVKVKKLVTTNGLLVVLTEPTYVSNNVCQSNIRETIKVDSEIIYYMIPDNTEIHDYSWIVKYIRKPEELINTLSEAVRGIEIRPHETEAEVTTKLEKERKKMTSLYCNETFKKCDAVIRENTRIVDIFSVNEEMDELVISYDDGQSLVLYAPMLYPNHSTSGFGVPTLTPIRNEDGPNKKMSRVISAIAIKYSNTSRYEIINYHLLDDNGVLWNYTTHMGRLLGQLCVSEPRAVIDKTKSLRICSITPYITKLIMLLENGELTYFDYAGPEFKIVSAMTGPNIQNNCKNIKRALSNSYETDQTMTLGNCEPNSKRTKTSHCSIENDHNTDCIDGKSGESEEFCVKDPVILYPSHEILLKESQTNCSDTERSESSYCAVESDNDTNCIYGKSKECCVSDPVILHPSHGILLKRTVN